MSTATTRGSHVPPRATGRPRAAGSSPTGLGTRADILQASAQLFCTVGYGSTSTHAIARQAGIRQASVYHHFGGKHEILLTLLTGTVQPSLDQARSLLARDEPAAARLWALCVSDVRLLSGGPDNVGSLYLLPEVDDDRFAPFAELRAELEGAYRRLIHAAQPVAPEDSAALVLGLVESVILRRRREPEAVGEGTARAIADAVLKVLDLGSEALVSVRKAGLEILSETE
ncbi:TetR/AcrR family transcriptional regulator [Naasia sp. SYSU D00057]|uniref:TetR/AcrR family transcriptional regulator n=1 Tax=Naasia sp. SYSU D00057 TaxID=2817380 RepID=UPI001B30C16C|nr:TetR/AcrR family transcriptional regulator [Naasia sp. SYSU D00057]